MRIRNIILAATIAVSALFVSVPVFADGKCADGLSGSECNKICDDPKISDSQKEIAGCKMTPDSENTLPAHIQNMINVAISVIGIIAVVVIVFAGQRILTGGGDPGKVNQAKNMIIYAVVAIVIATLAWAIINFVITATGK